MQSITIKKAGENGFLLSRDALDWLATSGQKYCDLNEKMSWMLDLVEKGEQSELVITEKENGILLETHAMSRTCRETNAYEKRIDFEGTVEQVGSIMNGISTIAKHHPSTITDLNIHLDQADDGVDVKIYLVLEDNPDGINGDEPVLDPGEMREKFLVIDPVNDETTESEWEPCSRLSRA